MSRGRVAVRPRTTDLTMVEQILQRARRRGFTRFVLPSTYPMTALEGESILREESGALRAGPHEPPIPIRTVDSESSLDDAFRSVSPGGTLAIEWVGDRVIPLENAIAARGDRFHLWVVAHSPAEVPGALGALEHGADLVLVDLRTPDEVDELESRVEGPLPSHLRWAELPIAEVRPVGLGDRVIVDTTSVLGPDEGLLVGSAAAFLFLVTSEATGSAFSRPRAFRVNAGSAHSYVLLADGSTRYLTELTAGDAVLVTSPEGSGRVARVGRIKVERRPMVLVRAEDGPQVRTVFLQEAESVRLRTAEGPTPTTQLSPGNKAVGVRLPPARHLGRAVQETIEER